VGPRQALDALGTSRLAAGRSWSSFFKVARGEEAMEPDRAPRTPPGWTAEIFLGDIYKALSIALTLAQLC
jgi:hypothetical protein